MFVSAEGSQSLLLPLVTPEQSQSGRFSYRETGAKRTTRTCLTQALGSLFAPSPEQCHVGPAWSARGFGRQEVMCSEQQQPGSAALGVTAEALVHGWSWRAGLGTASAARLQAIILSSVCHFN